MRNEIYQVFFVFCISRKCMVVGTPVVIAWEFNWRLIRSIAVNERFWLLINWIAGLSLNSGGCFVKRGVSLHVFALINDTNVFNVLGKC